MRESLTRIGRATRERVARLSPFHGRRKRFNLHLQDKWHRRAEQAVELWLRSADRLAGAHPLSVGDLGCGNERVRDLLASRLGDDFTYQGYDLQPQSREAVKLDVRRALPDREFDVVFALGLLEYLTDLEDFLARLRRICTSAISQLCRFRSAEPLGKAEREARGWRTPGSPITRVDSSRACPSELAGWPKTLCWSTEGAPVFGCGAHRPINPLQGEHGHAGGRATEGQRCASRWADL